MVARRIDRYQILEEVGSGGMAVVYKGLDTSLQREVAIKVLHPHLASREESRRRFSREARAVARLRHPSIVEIYDFSGDEAREAFIVTEFVAGRTLRVFGDEVGFFLPEIAALVVARLAEALTHAHEAGIVHRDLKPENVMVRADGALKLMDFGIARMTSGDEKMTMTGALVGSPLHMAPEIIEGREAGEAADVFALGTILYWMVTGKMAFAGNNTTQTLRQILEGQYVDPRLVAPACSDEIAALIERCLQREPAARPASMAELHAALEPIVAPLGGERIDETLRAFFLDPAAFAEAARRRLVERLVAEGEAALAEKRPARALSLFNRVLALDEGNARVHRHLGAMRRRRQLQKRLRIGALALSGLLAVGGGAFALRSLDVEEAAPAPAPPPEPAPAPLPAEPVAAAPPEPAVPAPPPEVEAPAAPAPKPSAPKTETEPRPEPKQQPAERPAPAPVVMQRVQLRWVPQGASLYIDGNRIETVAPAWSGELPAGEHTFALAHPACCQPWEEMVVLRPGDETLRRSVALAPLESGWFEIECEEPEAEVWFEGTFKGTVAQVNARGGVPVAFSKDDPGRDRYVKTVRFQVLPPRGRTGLAAASGEVVVRAGQKARTQRVSLEARDP
ncbi:serine/threonine-protein kinase [Vulgatibacter sp.]|uniref:serine/threonine-protein kinase n=1 Tax=Vulgatibacter sp. TaxID=1971226 RepID=UPI003565472C